MAVCSVRDLYHYVVNLGVQSDRPIGMLQLNKMLYIYQLVYVKIHDGDLLFCESFEAWPFWSHDSRDCRGILVWQMVLWRS